VTALREGLGAAVTARLFPEESGTTSDPVGWAEEALGERLWSKQVQIAESVVEHRHTAVRSAHGTGKSHTASRLVAWWVSAHELGEAVAVVSAPTHAQIEAIVFRELARAQQRGGLPGRITFGATPQWRVGPHLVALGRKPQDLVDPEQAAAAFQGIHARFVLVVLDEAAGVPPWLWDAVDSLTTNESARVLAIGNPTDPSSRFAKVCQPGSGWNVIGVSAFDTPAFTGERVAPELLELLTSKRWVEERSKRWGEESPLYIARVLGQFPAASEDSLIQPAWVEAAQARDLSAERIWASRLGVDVARSGSDETVVYRNHCGVVRIAHRARGHDLMRTSGAVAQLLLAEPESVAQIDVIGLGAGVFDRLREQDLPVTAFSASERAQRPDRFLNRRAEAYWQLREELREGKLDLDPDDEDLAAQVCAIRWRVNSRGQIQIESKDEMRKRGLPSPDRADAVSMAVAGAASGAGYLPVATAGTPTWDALAGESTERWLGRMRSEDEWAGGVMGERY
jgi:hypothetical protein